MSSSERRPLEATGDSGGTGVPLVPSYVFYAPPDDFYEAKEGKRVAKKLLVLSWLLMIALCLTLAVVGLAVMIRG